MNSHHAALFGLANQKRNSLLACRLLPLRESSAAGNARLVDSGHSLHFFASSTVCDINSYLL